MLVLNGELAVPCDSQSAIARLTIYRGIVYGKPMQVRDVDTRVLCNSVL